MDRHHQQHQASRVELPAAVEAAFGPESAHPFASGSDAAPHSKLGPILGLVSLLSGGAVVIATASILALHLS